MFNLSYYLLCFPVLLNFYTARNQIKAIKVHHLGPSRDKVLNKFFLRIITAIYLRKRTELRVRTQDQIRACCSPLHLTGLAIATFKQRLRIICRLPCSTQVEQVEE